MGKATRQSRIIQHIYTHIITLHLNDVREIIKKMAMMDKQTKEITSKSTQSLNFPHLKSQEDLESARAGNQTKQYRKYLRDLGRAALTL